MIFKRLENRAIDGVRHPEIVRVNHQQPRRSRIAEPLQYGRGRLLRGICDRTRRVRERQKKRAKPRKLKDSIHHPAGYK